MFPRSLYVAKEENYDSITLRFDLYSPDTEEIVEYNKLDEEVKESSLFRENLFPVSNYKLTEHFCFSI